MKSLPVTIKQSTQRIEVTIDHLDGMRYEEY